MFQILIVDDNANTRRLFEVVLTQNGFEAVTAENAGEAQKILDTRPIDLMVLDVMMPEVDGFTFTKILREAGVMLPILMITAKDTADDIREGFLSGTDDYMVKPVNEDEMVLRIHALLRRAKIASERRLTVGTTELRYDSLSVTEGEKTTVLPKKEFQMLFKFLSFPNKTFTRRQLMNEFWSADSDSDERTVDVHINRLRERFRDSADFEILTVRGLGYKAVHK
ncbi:MAG: response regulator transcription factor [Clostridia bacterium]|nr:response regulator transcription factor [Clostridia bacterium]